MKSANLKTPRPPELEAAKSALEVLSFELPDDYKVYLQNALPQLVRKMSQAGELVDADTLIEHVCKGKDHLEDLKKEYNKPPKETIEAFSALKTLAPELTKEQQVSLKKALPALARKMAQAGEDVKADMLIDHVRKGEEHLAVLKEKYSQKPKVAVLTYEGVLQELADREYRLQHHPEEAFQQAISDKDMERLWQLPSLDGNNILLQRSAENGHVEVVSALLEAGADIHANNDDALRWSAENGHVEVVSALLEAGADIHANNDAALRRSASNGHVEVVSALLEAGADIHAGYDDALRWSASNGHMEVVSALLEAGADIDLLDQAAKERYANYSSWVEAFPTMKISGALSEFHFYHFVPDAYEMARDILHLEGYNRSAKEKYAYNASCLFKSEERILQYLQKWGEMGKQPLHDIIQDIQIPQEGRPDLKAWGDAVLKYGPKMAKFVKLADRLPQPMKNGSGGWSYTKTKEEIAKHAFKRGHENPKLATFCLEHAWDDDDFEDAIRQIKKFENMYKTSDLSDAANDNIKGGAIPDITIDGTEFGKDGYTFRKLPDGDVRGLLLGEFTNCCQHLANAGRDCAKHGFLSEKGGFYVVEDNKTGNIVAQTWAWRGKQGEIVFDSLESLSGHFNAEKWKSLCEAYSEKVKAVAKDAGITVFHVGAGGATPKIGFIARIRAKPIDYKGFRDSHEQYQIATFNIT